MYDSNKWKPGQDKSRDTEKGGVAGLDAGKKWRCEMKAELFKGTEKYLYDIEMVGTCYMFPNIYCLHYINYKI